MIFLLSSYIFPPWKCISLRWNWNFFLSLLFFFSCYHHDNSFTEFQEFWKWTILKQSICFPFAFISISSVVVFSFANFSMKSSDHDFHEESYRFWESNTTKFIYSINCLFFLLENLINKIINFSPLILISLYQSLSHN